MQYRYDDERNSQCREIEFQHIHIFVEFFPSKIKLPCVFEVKIMFFSFSSYMLPYFRPTIGYKLTMCKFVLLIIEVTEYAFNLHFVLCYPRMITREGGKLNSNIFVVSNQLVHCHLFVTKSPYSHPPPNPSDGVNVDGAH